MNFEDPQVWNDMTDITKGKQLKLFPINWYFFIFIKYCRTIFAVSWSEIMLLFILKHQTNRESLDLILCLWPDSFLAKQLWKESYGFDFFSFSPGFKGASDNVKCYKNCLKAEFSNFARKCQKKGGFFKCCMSGWEMSNNTVIMI